ncbi:DUF2507 domain-containing protein [Brevibacillus marinus]|uniref:DUF2507 domain-containing protein n=1 Tax=Brevibacillus marinus TaxID=2496837 RepID=UPI0013E0BE96|nr:DUF2507 domain-containing protein [Brevibacillus marinus]
MKRTIDPLSALFSAEVMTQVEQMSMPYLGYLLLREKLAHRLLGESEAAILYWTGKELGNQLIVDSAEQLELIFIRLGLGRLDLLAHSEGQLRFRLSHTAYALLPLERLSRMLSWETGLLAGAVAAWAGRPAQAVLELQQGTDKKPVALISVRLDPVE